MKIITFVLFGFIFLNCYQVSLAQNVEDFYQLGKSYFKQKDYIKAKKKFDFVIANNKMYYEAYTYRGRCFIGLNVPDSAIVDYNTALKTKPDYLPALFYRAEYFTSINNYSKALKDLNVVINQKPKFLPALIHRAELYNLTDKPELAFRDYSSAIDNGSKNPELFYLRSAFYFDKHNYNNALQDINNAIALNKSIDRYWYQKGIVLQSLNRKNTSISAYSTCINLNPEFQQAYERRAFLLKLTGEFDRSIEDNDFLIKHFKLREDTLFLNNAEMLMKIKDYSAADRYYIKALSVNSKNETALIGRANVSIAKEKPSIAISYLKRILRNNSKSYNAYYELGKIYYYNKDYELALENFTYSLRYKKLGETYFYRASVYYSLKQSDKACSDIHKSKELGYNKALDAVNVFCH